MNKKIIFIGLLGVIILGGIATASITNIIENDTHDLNRGFFEANLGKRGNERPFLNLQGTYHYRGRILIVQGTEDNRFYGLFRGNTFIIRIQIRGRAQTIVGQCRFDENHEAFTGLWGSRILQTRGWIEGSFN